HSSTPGFFNFGDYLTALGSSAQIFDPTSSNTPDGSGRTAFANNMIPIANIKQNVGNILALFPTPTVTCGAVATPACVANNFSAAGAGPFNQYSFDTRIDYNAPRNFQIFGRFSLDYFNLSGAGGLGPLGGAGFGPGGLNGSSTVHNYSLASGFTKLIGAKWLTDFRFGYFKYNPQTAYSDASQSPMDKFVLPALNSGTA